MSISNADKGVQSLQAARGIAALAVVAFHANLVVALPKYFGAEPAPWANGGDSGVHLFFVLSGLIMVMSHKRDVTSNASPLGFWWRRIRRIVPPLWAALAFCLIGQFAVFGTTSDAWTIITAFSIAPVKVNTILAVEWTLRHEVIFYLLFGVLIWNFRIGVAALASWFALSAYTTIHPIGEMFAIIASPYNLLFLFGCISGLIIKSGKKIAAPRAIFAIGSAIFICTWASKSFSTLNENSLDIILYGVGAAMMLSSICQLENDGHVKGSKILGYFGDASYSIYLAHFPAISFLAKAANKLDVYLNISPSAWFAIIMLGSILCGLIFYHLIEQPLLRVFPARPPFHKHSNRHAV